VVRFVAKLEFVAGVAFAVAEAIGVDGYLHIQEKLGELITQIETIKALALAAESQACHDESGVLVPEIAYLDTARNLGTRFYPRAIEILQQVGGSGFMQTPSTVYELDGPIYRLLRLYLEGASVGAEQKVKLFKLAWDLIGSPLGSRHELYERFYAGDPVRSFANQYLNYDKSVLIETVWKLLK
jgi:4-hydroxyphenylacetate 3-monooxygenase